MRNRNRPEGWDRFFAMVGEIHILEVEKDGEDGLIVKFSDGTICGYVVEELLEMVSCPVTVPAAVGSNSTLRVAV